MRTGSATRRTTALVSLVVVVSVLLSGGLAHALLDNNLKCVDLTDMAGDLPLDVVSSTQILWQTEDWEHSSWKNPGWPAGGGDSVGYPTVVHNDRGPNPDYKYYLYYAHHNPMSGIGCAVADSIEGPYVKLADLDPGRDDSKVLTVPNYNPSGPNPDDPSHYSSPCVVWNEEEQLWFMYFHYYNHYHGAWTANPSYPGYGHQMTGLATCPDLSSHNWTIWTDPAWGSVSVWDIIPVLPTTGESWMDSQSSYHAIQRLPGGQWLAFLRGTSDSSPYPRLGFGTSTDGRSWSYFLNNPVITPEGVGERGGVYRPNFIGYLGEGEYLVAWAESPTAGDVPDVIYGYTTDFVNFQRDARGFASWEPADGLVSPWREGNKLYLFAGKCVHRMDLPVQDTFSISGTVTSGGGPLEDVVVSADGHAIATAADGTYTIDGLATGTYTVTPSLTEYTFNPTSREVTVNETQGDATGADFTGTQKTYSISGTVTDNADQTLEGVEVGADGHSATTAADGTYTVTGLVADTYTATPSLAQYAFDPASREVTVNETEGNATGEDFVGTQATYSISGTMTNAGSPLEGVEVTADGHSDTTAADGSYTIDGLAAGIYTVTPSLTEYTFEPTSREVTVNETQGDATGADFTGTQKTYSISGTISGGGAGLAGVEVTADGHSTTTAADGTYTLTGLVADTYTVTPSLAEYTFDPTSREVTVNETEGNATQMDFVATPLYSRTFAAGLTMIGIPVAVPGSPTMEDLLEGNDALW